MTVGDWVEPRIVINDQVLSNAEAMTVRVAINTFLMDVDLLGDDEIGKALAAGYRAACISIFRKMGRLEERV